jgi:hypothetical protein
VEEVVSKSCLKSIIVEVVVKEWCIIH